MNDHYREEPVVGEKAAVDQDLESGKPSCSDLPEALPYAQDCEKHLADPDRGAKDSNLGCLSISRKKFFLGLAIAIVLIIVTVVGAVVGVLQSRSSSTPQKVEATVTPNTTNTTTPSGPSVQDSINATSSRIGDNSGLAITGWREASGFKARLFYQDGDGYLRIVAMDSATNQWSEGSPFAKAKLGTPLAASTHNRSIYDPTRTDYQVHVYYLDDDSKIREHVFDQNDNTGADGPLSKLNMKANAKSRLGAYWPSVAFQDESNIISEARFNCTGVDSTTDCWAGHSLNILAQEQSPIAQVPRGRRSGLLLYFQRENDKDLINYSWENTTGTWVIDEYEQAVPPSVQIAALATARNKDSDANNQWVLYQDTFGKIQYNYRTGPQGGHKGWKAPQTSAVFDQAKNNTPLACLHQASSDDLPMEYGEDMQRCYFVDKEGNVIQVYWKNEGWNSMGIVPSPSQDEQVS